MLKVVIFLAVTVTNGCLTSDTGLPPYWDDVPDHLSHFPIVDGTTIIDPWNYLERMAMYKLLLEKTRTAMVPFGPNNTGNVLWGLPMQHGWQLQSGRLGKFGGEPDNCPANQSFCISVSSWWAGMNYYLAVIPFVGAVRAGYYSYWPHPIRLKAPSVTIPSVAPFCKSVQECLATVPASTEAWTHFFLYLKNDTKMDQPSTVESTSSIVSNGSTGKLSPLEDAVLQVMWEAHITSIADGESRVRPLLSRMAQPEQDFGVSWANAVDFLAATHWPTDQPTTHKYQVAGLPPRVLHEGDVPPHIPDMTPQVNELLATLNKMYALNTVTDGKSLVIWRRLNCSYRARYWGRQFLENIDDHMMKTLQALGGLIWDLIFVSCDQSCVI